jgi:hypothetical protein
MDSIDETDFANVQFIIGEDGPQRLGTEGDVYRIPCTNNKTYAVKRLADKDAAANEWRIIGLLGSHSGLVRSHAVVPSGGRGLGTEGSYLHFMDCHADAVTLTDKTEKMGEEDEDKDLTTFANCK